MKDGSRKASDAAGSHDGAPLCARTAVAIVFTRRPPPLQAVSSGAGDHESAPPDRSDGADA